MRPRPLALIVLDGWGLAPPGPGNAIALADTPNMDGWWRDMPHVPLAASGEAVGLTPGQMGNSNVGHLNLGAGRIVYQDLMRITKAIQVGEFFRNPALVDAITHVRESGGNLHLMGLCSDGGVHSHIEHLYALVRMARDLGVTRVYVHCFTDGRDVPPTSGAGFVSACEARLHEIGTGRIVTVMGRYYAMDRDKRWDRTEKAWRTIVRGEGISAPSALAAVEQAYTRGETDEFIMPTVVGEPVPLTPADSVVFFNFRADRARQISHAIADARFTPFDRGAGYVPPHFTAMADYDETLAVPVAFPPLEIRHTLGEVLSEAGFRQLRIAETEKYAHVTFFFNGGREEPFPGEERLLIPSPKVATYDLQPEMSAPAVTRTLLQKIEEETYDFILLNYANPDMVGHTGVLAAAIQAVSTVDRLLGEVVRAVVTRGGAALVVADHGNAEEMIDPDGGPHTAHTSNLVPCVLLGVPDATLVPTQPDGSALLADIAPTLVELAGLSQPEEMTGKSLLRRR